MDEKSILEKLDAVLNANKELVSINEEQSKKIRRLEKKSDSFSVEIGCNLIMGANLSSPNGDLDMQIKFREILTISSKDVEQILKKSENRKMFSTCLLYFIDNEMYNYFSIVKKFDLSDDTIFNILFTKDINKIKDFFDSVTSNKFDANVYHTLFYKIVVMSGEGRLDGMSYDIREFVEKYFTMELKMAYTLYKSLIKMNV